MQSLFLWDQLLGAPDRVIEVAITIRTAKTLIARSGVFVEGSWRPPVNRSCAFRCLGVSVCNLGASCLRYCKITCAGENLVLLLSLLLCMYIRAGHEMGQTLWGPWLIHAICAVSALMGAVPLVSVPRSPKAALQRSGAAHGPLHPAVFFSKLCCLCCFVWIRNLWFVWKVCCFGMFFQVWFALKVTTLVRTFGSHSLLSLAWFLCSPPSMFSSVSVVFPLSLYLSGAGPRQTTWWFVFPLCLFLHPGHGLPRRSVCLHLHLPTSRPPPRRNLFLSVWVFSHVDDVVGVFSRPWFFIVFFISLTLFSLGSIACVEVTLKFKRGRATIMARPFIITIVVCVFVWTWDGGPCGLPTEPSIFPPLPPRKPGPDREMEVGMSRFWHEAQSALGVRFFGHCKMGNAVRFLFLWFWVVSVLSFAVCAVLFLRSAFGDDFRKRTFEFGCLWLVGVVRCIFC